MLQFAWSSAWWWFLTIAEIVCYLAFAIWALSKVPSIRRHTGVWLSHALRGVRRAVEAIERRVRSGR